MIKYLGSKRRLIPLIVKTIEEAGFSSGSSVVDLFSGTSRVGQALKKNGYVVRANDHNAYAHTLARCYVEADVDVVDDAAKVIAELNRVKGKAGWFTRTYCEESRFFQPKNGARIEAIRTAIEKMALEPALKSVVLTSLLEAADRVDSTVGVQMAYLKSWSARSFNDLELRVPDLIPRPKKGRCTAHLSDAADAAEALEGDVFYLDPPYNNHSYLSNYHIWETLVAWDDPEVYGAAMKRVECQEKKSAFNSKVLCQQALIDVVQSAKAKALVVSFSDEGYLSKDELLTILSMRGPVRVIEQGGHPRYVGARIGIYNPQGEKVGAISHTKNTELLFVVDCI